MQVKNREELVMMTRIVVGELPDLRREITNDSGSGSSIAGSCSDVSAMWEASQPDSEDEAE